MRAKRRLVDGLRIKVCCEMESYTWRRPGLLPTGEDNSEIFKKIPRDKYFHYLTSILKRPLPFIGIGNDLIRRQLYVSLIRRAICFYLWGSIRGIIIMNKLGVIAARDKRHFGGVEPKFAVKVLHFIGLS